MDRGQPHRDPVVSKQINVRKNTLSRKKKVAMPRVPSQTVGVIDIDGNEELPFAISGPRFDAVYVERESCRHDFPETIYMNVGRLERELDESYRVIARRLKRSHLPR